MNKVIINIEANRGYAVDQVKGRMTVGELKRLLEDFDDEAEIVTKDLNNEYGANWGIALDVEEYEPDYYYVDIVVYDKAAKEEIKEYSYKRVYDCEDEEEAIELMKKFDINEKYFDTDKYELIWKENY